MKRFSTSVIFAAARARRYPQWRVARRFLFSQPAARRPSMARRARFPSSRPSARHTSPLATRARVCAPYDNVVSVSDPVVGDVVDTRYELRRLIARGGMGLVFEAHHRFTRRTVALKLLPDDLRLQKERAGDCCARPTR